MPYLFAYFQSKLTTPIAWPNNRVTCMTVLPHRALLPTCRFRPSVRERAWSIVPFAHSECAPCFPTHSALSHWQIRSTTKLLISREDQLDFSEAW